MELKATRSAFPVRAQWLLVTSGGCGRGISWRDEKLQSSLTSPLSVEWIPLLHGGMKKVGEKRKRTWRYKNTIFGWEINLLLYVFFFFFFSAFEPRSTFFFFCGLGVCNEMQSWHFLPFHVLFWRNAGPTFTKLPPDTSNPRIFKQPSPLVSYAKLQAAKL